jgi:UDP-N-acetylglucosamine 2-epimerase (non-hydrolysing)
MEPNQTLIRLTANLLNALDAVIRETKPDWILAQGDTSTVLAASLAAFYNRVAFGHVEAGLRTGDKWNPFPEEVNRRIADIFADAYFVPTPRGKSNLLRENIDKSQILIAGNTIVDALTEIAGLPFTWNDSDLDSLPETGRFVLVTLHRRESFGETFRQLCLAVRDLAIRFPQVMFVYPVHLNPQVQTPVHVILSGYPNIVLLKPLDYRTMIQLLKRSTLVLTDSGGIQEEAPSFHVPTLVLRDVTERPEGIQAGVAKLVGTERARIVQEAADLLTNESAYRDMSLKASPYGDGKAAERIVSYLLKRPTTEFIPAI